MTIPAYVTNRDVHAAQTIVDQLNQLGGETHTATEWNLTARGTLAAWAADLREAGYAEGIQVGRRQIAHLVHEALDSEGL